ncbi:hypothetical protein pipiens_001497 [Culex pipiens pipiens]|uniref:Uncharacterized protein n=1 Tax=Culex pipiens pipiens TaxID=38569 RepID=A0ABD1CNL2_CULPP
MERIKSTENCTPRRRSKRLACRPSATPELAPKRPRRRALGTPNLGWRLETPSAAESDSIIFVGRFESPPSARPVIQELDSAVPEVRNPVREGPETSTTTVQASVTTVDAWTATAEDDPVEIFRIATEGRGSLDNASDESSLYYSCEEESFLFPVGVQAQEFDISDGTVLTKHQGGNLYTNTVAFEEQEAAKRSPEADSKLFHATCDELRKLFDEIVTLKKEEVKIMNEKKS